MLTLFAAAGALAAALSQPPFWLVLTVAALAVAAIAAGGMKFVGVLTPDSQYPFYASEGTFINGEGAATINPGKLVFKEDTPTRKVLLTTGAIPIGYVGICLGPAAAPGKETRVRWFGECVPQDFTTGVLDTNAITNAGETFQPAAAGALATHAAVANRRAGFVKVKHASTGVLFINGLAP